MKKSRKKNVYVLISTLTYSDEVKSVLGVYSSREKAEAGRGRVSESKLWSLEIVEFVLN